MIYSNYKAESYAPEKKASPGPPSGPSKTVSAGGWMGGNSSEIPCYHVTLRASKIDAVRRLNWFCYLNLPRLFFCHVLYATPVVNHWFYYHPLLFPHCSSATASAAAELAGVPRSSASQPQSLLSGATFANFGGLFGLLNTWVSYFVALFSRPTMDALPPAREVITHMQDPEEEVSEGLRLGW